MNEIATVPEFSAPLTIEQGLTVDSAHRTLATLDDKHPDKYTSEDRQGLVRAEDYLARVFAPAGQEGALVELRQLKAFKPRRNTDTNEYAFVAATLAKDLSSFPLWAVQLGCERYRKKADKTFFPDTAEDIIGLARPELRRWQSVRELAGRLKASMDWTPPVSVRNIDSFSDKPHNQEAAE